MSSLSVEKMNTLRKLSKDVMKKVKPSKEEPLTDFGFRKLYQCNMPHGGDDSHQTNLQVHPDVCTLCYGTSFTEI